MTYSIISKALAIGFLLASACSSAALADQGLGDQDAVQEHDGASVITDDQQRKWDMKMLSWQQNLADDLQKKIANDMLLKNNIDYRQDSTVFSADLAVDRERIVRN